jgi:hypothetical protein
MTSDVVVEMPTEQNLLLQARLRRIIECDRQVMALARARQAELGDRLGRLNQGRKASRAYSNQISVD